MKYKIENISMIVAAASLLVSIAALKQAQSMATLAEEKYFREIKIKYFSELARQQVALGCWSQLADVDVISKDMYMRFTKDLESRFLHNQYWNRSDLGGNPESNAKFALNWLSEIKEAEYAYRSGLVELKASVQPQNRELAEYICGQ